MGWPAPQEGEEVLMTGEDDTHLRREHAGEQRGQQEQHQPNTRFLTDLYTNIYIYTIYIDVLYVYIYIYIFA